MNTADNIESPRQPHPRHGRRGRSKTARPVLALGAAAVLVLPLAACGGDDDDAADESSELCVAFMDLVASEDGSPEEEAAFEALSAAVSDDDVATIDALADALANMPEDGFPGFEFFEHLSDTVAVFDRDCDATTLEITATDYAFGGVPESVAAGPAVVSFDNEGTEIHEFIVFRKANGEQRTGEQLIMADAWDQVTDVGFALALPGDQVLGIADLSEPGEYFALCFLPVGATPDAFEEMMAAMMEEGGEPGEGDEGDEGDDGHPPHFVVGMITDFTVTS